MKKIFVLATMLISTLGCAQKEETTFKNESLNYVLKQLKINQLLSKT